MAEAGGKGATKPDVGSAMGLVLGFGGIIGGLLLEGGHMSDIAQPTAALIVLGGTIGATLLCTPWRVFRAGVRALVHVFFEKTLNPAEVTEQIIGFATRARKQGIVSLEAETDLIPDPFLRKALTLAVDGTDLQEIRKMMELEIAIEERRTDAEAKVFEQAGGFAPTIGIIGAVMGLIQVMKNLANIDEVGRGIAVAFVATVYGVGSANLFFLPAAGKIKARGQEALQLKDLMLEGVSAIVEGLNPKLIRSKLNAYLDVDAPVKKTGKATAPSQAAPAES
jgi:chemotaxis protein MotA